VIGQLRGELVWRHGSTAVIDVSGVGYEVSAPAASLDAWQAEGGPVVAIVSTQVREDAITLFAFASREEREAFHVLLGVSGIGAKLALAALDSLGAGPLRVAVETGDVTALCRITGVGKRTAQRMAVDLKGKLPAVGGLPSASSGKKPAAAAPDMFAMALERLGWSKAEIDAARLRLEAAGLAEDAPVGERVRIALRSSLRT
jgi:Holliday junction DNA helicase RuvA